MRKLRVHFPDPQSDRDAAVKKSIMTILVAATAGFDVVPIEVKPDGEPHIGFTLDAGESTGMCRVDLSTDGVPGHDHSLGRHPTYMDAMIAGQRTIEDPWAKINSLDSDDFDYIVVVPDTMTPPPEIPEDRLVTESNLLANVTALDGVSHALLLSPDGERPLISERQIAYRCCMTFYVGNDLKGALSKDRNILCTSFDDFLMKAEMMAGESQSTKIFTAKYVNETFSETAVTGRDARNWIAALLQDKVRDDFGLFEFHRADARLLSKVKGSNVEKH